MPTIERALVQLPISGQLNDLNVGKVNSALYPSTVGKSSTGLLVWG